MALAVWREPLEVERDVISRGPLCVPQRSFPPKFSTETGLRYSKCSPLTVLLRPQFQTIRFACQQGVSTDWLIYGEKP